MNPVNNPFEMYKEIEWGAHDAEPEDFAGVYGRINVKISIPSAAPSLILFIERRTGTRDSNASRGNRC